MCLYYLRGVSHGKLVGVACLPFHLRYYYSTLVAFVLVPFAAIHCHLVTTFGVQEVFMQLLETAQGFAVYPVDGS